MPDSGAAAATHPEPVVHRLAAFADGSSGGNPAGVVVTDVELAPAQMQRIAADVGYSETAFCVPTASGAWDVRYFAPVTEVPFCGHATIAAGVLLAGAGGPGTFELRTPVGVVPVNTTVTADGAVVATLTSREPVVETAGEELVAAALRAFSWEGGVLDGARPPVVADAGARHLLLAVADASTLDDFDYAFDDLAATMREADLTTVAVLRAESPDRWHARNAFAVGGVVEDPATGAAAAALGGWLRATGAVLPPARVEVRQGAQMGRPSRLLVDVPPHGGIRVTGTAIPIR